MILELKIFNKLKRKVNHLYALLFSNKIINIFISFKIVAILIIHFNICNYHKKIGVAYLGIVSQGSVGKVISNIINELYNSKKYNIYVLATGKIFYKISPPIKIYNISKDENIIKYIKGNIIKVIFENYFSDKYDDTLKNIGIKIISILHTEYFGLLYCCPYLLRNLYKLKKFDAVNFPVEQDYYLFRRIGIKNLQLMPNYLTYDPNSVTCSNLKTKTIILIGDDRKIKNMELGINAMSLIVKKVHSVRMFVLTYKKNRLLRLAKKLRIDKYITFIENCKDPAPYIKNASVMLYTSHIESFSQVLSEGLSFCLPVVTNNLHFLQLTQKNVINAKPDDPRNMAKEAIQLLNNFDYRIKVSKKINDSIKEFSHYNTTKKWLKLIGVLLQGKNATNRYFRQMNLIKNMKKYERGCKKLFELTKRRLPKCKKLKFEDITDLNKVKTFNIKCN